MALHWVHRQVVVPAMTQACGKRAMISPSLELDGASCKAARPAATRPAKLHEILFVGIDEEDEAEALLIETLGPLQGKSKVLCDAAACWWVRWGGGGGGGGGGWCPPSH